MDKNVKKQWGRIKTAIWRHRKPGQKQPDLFKVIEGERKVKLF